MNRRRSFAIVMAAMALGASPSHGALRSKVVSNGAVAATGSARRLLGTVGQTAVGRTSGSSRILSMGFWGGGNVVVTAVEPPASGAAVKRFAFGPAMPSPTTSEARFALTLPTSGRVEMKIFDVSGRQIDGLAAAPLDPGEHVIRWRASSFPAGLYFARLLVNGEARAMRRVVLVR